MNQFLIDETIQISNIEWTVNCFYLPPLFFDHGWNGNCALKTIFIGNFLPLEDNSSQQDSSISCVGWFGGDLCSFFYWINCERANFLSEIKFPWTIAKQNKWEEKEKNGNWQSLCGGGMLCRFVIDTFRDFYEGTFTEAYLTVTDWRNHSTSSQDIVKLLLYVNYSLLQISPARLSAYRFSSNFQQLNNILKRVERWWRRNISSKEFHKFM